MEQVVSTFLAKKNTNGFVAIKGDFVFSSIVTTNLQKTLQPGAEHIYHRQTSDDSQPDFPHCITHWLIPAEMKVHQGKQQISMGSELPLVLPHWLQ